MMNVRILVAVSAIAVLASCTKSGIQERTFEKQQDDVSRGVVSMNMEPVRFEDGTKTTISADEQIGLKFSWSQKDTVGVYTDQGGYAHFTVTGGEGTSNATFDGQGFSLVKGNDYYAVYPYSTALENTESISLDYSKMTINGKDDISGLLPYDVLYSSTTATEDGTASFMFKHISSFGRLTLKMPKAGNFVKIDLIPTYDGMVGNGSMNIKSGVWSPGTGLTVRSIPMKNVSTSSINENIVLWIPFAPQNMSGNAFAAIVYDDKGAIYSARLEGRNMKSGMAYKWEASMSEYSAEAAGTHKGTYITSTTLPNLPSGQYSGITRISDTQYAVVHDTKQGGGIFLVNLNFSSNGSLKSYSYSIPEGTSSATNNRDPEGIAYFPKEGTLFVSGEGDQKILEYFQNGQPTGNSLAIPEDMSTKYISGNAGFEALSYNDNYERKLFWTTTEENLSKDKGYDKNGRQLLRLQSFNGENFKAAERYFYLTDKSQSDRNKARFYAFGVPDILALDDGKLLIIEREAFIPSEISSDSDFLEILAAAAKIYVTIKLYEVDPVNDKGGILSKHLVYSTSSSALNFANYEGICPGPVIGGKQSVILISDSQDRYLNLLSDHLMVLTI